MHFQSAFLAGFECSCHRFPDGRQLDLLASTGHAQWAESDYAHAVSLGLRTARDGVRWHLVNPAPYAYDWSSVLPMLRAARATGMQVIWDLCHFGWPQWIDIWSSRFPEAFARYAAAVARLIAQESELPTWFCPINEISYWSWAGGDMAHFSPCGTGRGGELKRQLVRAFVQAADAIREIDPGARFLAAEPMIAVHPWQPGDDGPAAAANASQFEAVDMITGRAQPELGGDARYLDIVGVNYYPHNQWLHCGPQLRHDDPRYRPLRELLAEQAQRHGRPILIAETGAEGAARAPWLRYVADQALLARGAGVDVAGICLYPVTDYPGWEDNRYCSTGLLSAPSDTGQRAVYAPLEVELRKQAARFGDGPVGLLDAPRAVALGG
nr:beta-glucosidase [uncultured Achromobacter sp.]